MRKILIVCACLLLVFGAYLTHNSVGSKVETVTAAGSAYSGTFYIAGNGGHYAVADITIDPSADHPIKLGKDLDRIVLGSAASYPVHDPRIDVNDRTKMYFSTYKPDKAAEGKAHVGLIDLKDGKVLKDITIALDERAKWQGAVYCASGQSKENFIPVTMTGEAYIDILKKSDFSLVNRVFLDKEIGKDNYWFFHGTNSPDMKTFVVVANGTEKWAEPKTPGKPNGKVEVLLLDMPELLKGKVKVLAKNTLQGEPGKTLTFRQYYSNDGKYIFQSAADRMYVLDASTLKVLDERTNLGGECHDAMPTPDGKYAILTLRSDVQSEKDPESKDKVKDGLLALYDVKAKKLVGKPTSVCYACHKALGLHVNSPLCGIDGNFKK